MAKTTAVVGIAKEGKNKKFSQLKLPPIAVFKVEAASANASNSLTRKEKEQMPMGDSSRKKSE
ncbi:MAG: hypothetical protein LCH63_11575 [Candidatus Melainabacteria bacterium]|nr:hypothetical protein [Candidatus Melainabacteria bacterium]